MGQPGYVQLNLRSIWAAVRRRRFLPVLDGGMGVLGVAAADDVSVPGVVNVDELVEWLSLGLGNSDRFSVWILSCSGYLIPMVDKAI